MIRKLCIAAGLALSLGTSAFADTPIGPGATGSGGTGPNAADRTDASKQAGYDKQGAPAQRNDAKGKGTKGSASAESREGPVSAPNVGSTGATTAGGKAGGAGR